MFIHSQKRNPQTHLKDPNMVWDFFSNHPMATHQVRYFLINSNFNSCFFFLSISLCFFIPIVVYPMVFVICMVMVRIHLKWLMIKMNLFGLNFIFE